MIEVVEGRCGEKEERLVVDVTVLIARTATAIDDAGVLCDMVTRCW